MKRTILLALCVLLAGVSSRQPVSVAITPQHDSPVAISDCTLVRQFVPLARGVSVQGFKTGVVFKNVSATAIRSVTFGFEMLDSMDAPIDRHELTSTGTYAPNVEIDNITWLVVDSWPTLGVMRCSVRRVQFADGTSWEVSDAEWLPRFRRAIQALERERRLWWARASYEKPSGGHGRVRRPRKR